MQAAFTAQSGVIAKRLKNILTEKTDLLHQIIHNVVVYEP